MKKLFTLIIIYTISLSVGCKKEEVPTVVTPKDLAGSWELRSVIGGYIDITAPQPSYPPGNGTIFNFTETTYEELKDGQIIKSGTYQLSKEKFFDSDRLMYRIVFDGDTAAFKQYVELIDGKLKIYKYTTIAADGTESFYEKIVINSPE